VAIIRACGIDYVEAALAPEESGIIEKTSDSYRIIVNVGHAPVRKRFTAAHELGHYTYHRPLIGDGISDGMLYRSENHLRYANKAITRQHETQANKFAAMVLMPKNLIERLILEGDLNPRANADDLATLAKALAVSEQALKIRLSA